MESTEDQEVTVAHVSKRPTHSEQPTDSEPVVPKLTSRATVEFTARNVVVVGKKGAGKSTIIKHIIQEVEGGESAQQSSTLVSNEWCSKVESPDGMILSLYKVETPYELFSTSRSATEARQRYTDELKKKTPDLQDVNLIMLVFRDGYFTTEEKRIFEAITSSLSPKAREVCVLIVTGCEEHSKEKRKKIVDRYRNDKDTFSIVRNVDEVICVGFPDMADTDPEFQAKFVNGIAQDQKRLLELIQSREKIVSREGMFLPATSVVHEILTQIKCNLL